MTRPAPVRLLPTDRGTTGNVYVHGLYLAMRVDGVAGASVYRYSGDPVLSPHHKLMYLFPAETWQEACESVDELTYTERANDAARQVGIDTA